MKGSPADPNRIYCSQSSGGWIPARSCNAPATAALRMWEQPGTNPGEPTTGPGGMPKGRKQQVHV